MDGGLCGCSSEKSVGRYNQRSQAFVGVLMVDAIEVDGVAHRGDGECVGHGRRRATMVAGSRWWVHPRIVRSIYLGEIFM